jgi:hypothetical protein
MGRIGGIIEVKANGELYSAKGSWTYNLGVPKREMVIGSDSVHGHKELPQEPMIEGVITDRNDLDVKTLLSLEAATVTLSLANGKVIVLRDAVFTGDGNVTTEEGEIAAKFSGLSAEEIR